MLAKMQTERIIPTGVGKSATPGIKSFPSTDHPHGRGEKQMGPHVYLCPLGSSPRAWGKEFNGRRVIGATGIIPTGVGKS